MDYHIDPQALLHQTINGPTSTLRLLLPTGTPFLAKCTKVEHRVNTIKQGEDAGKPMVSADYTWEINDPDGAIAKSVKRRNLAVRHSILLDMTEDYSALSEAEGDNIKLWRLREAVGFKDQPFNLQSPVGVTAEITIKHRPDEDGQPAYEEVALVRPAA